MHGTLRLFVAFAAAVAIAGCNPGKCIATPL
jgi:hypothetical protein